MPIDYDQIAKKHGFSREAVETVAVALSRGRRTQAQFNHPELGGIGQWQPGMIMIGDMFNQTLKARVDALCTELASLELDSVTANSSTNQRSWWPRTFTEQPAMVGSQDNARYAYFHEQRRLIVQRNDTTIVYDVGNHHLTGVSQQQNTLSQTLIFHTKRGATVSEKDFDRIE